MDAFTSKEYTCFYAKVLDEHLDVAVELLADIVQHPRFDPVELERERQVVLEEIRMVDDTPDEMVYDLFSDRFWPGEPLGRPIQGTAATVGALRRRELLAFFKGSYRPENLLIVAAGNLDHARMARLVRRAFAGLDLAGGKAARRRPPRSEMPFVKHRRKEIEQIHLLLGVPAFPETYERRFPLYVLNAILGGTLSSRLFQRIREERGLAYTVYSAVNAFADTGMLSIYAATGADTADEVLRLVRAELRDLRDRGPDDDELRVAKEHLKGSLMLSLESTSSRMTNLARQEIYFGRQRTLAATLAGVDRVTRTEVHAVASELVDGRRLGLAAVGRVDRLKVRERELAL
jgi:predicted Zn-dependent peptidase